MTGTRPIRAAALAAVFLVALPAHARAQSSAATSDPGARPSELSTPPRTAVTEYEGAPALGLALRRLGRTPRVLMIGAHPDDENTALLSTLTLGHGADVAYLSLTRGEGGQNLIGPELQEALGLIRSEELLAARRLDGAGQFFTRAIDYGYSKNAEEAFRHWPRDELLADAVGVVRSFRPDIIVSVFSGTPRDGHGQHQAAGIMAREAFEAAGDPNRFPDQLARGLRPHSPAMLYQALWRSSGDEGVRLATGTLDPLFGRSHYQIAMASRGRHRSQGMGRSLPPGPDTSGLRLVASREPGEGAAARAPSADGGPLVGESTGRADPALFAGVPVALRDRVRTLTGGAAPRRDLLAAAAAYDSLANALRSTYDAFRPDALVPRLTAALGHLDRALDALGTVESAAADELRFHIAGERADLYDALRRAARVEFDAIADDEAVVPGQSFELELTLWNGGARPVRIAALEPRLPPGWEATPVEPATATGAVIADPNTLVERRFRVRVPDDAEPTEPYFLRDARDGDMYAWPAAASIRGRPFGPQPVNARATLEVDGTALPLDRPATVELVDRARGAERRPVRVVPAVAVGLEPATAVLPLGREKTFRFAVRLAAEAPDGIAGTLRLDAPDGWSVSPADTTAESVAPETSAAAAGESTGTVRVASNGPATAPVAPERVAAAGELAPPAPPAGPVAVRVRFPEAGAVRTIEFVVRPPAGVDAGAHPVRAVFGADDGRRFARGYDLVDYDHVEPHTLYRDAAATVTAIDVRVPAGLRVGYVMGAGDDGPQALDQLGVAVELLDAEALASGDLDRYDAVVTGIRAYEVRPDLVAHNERLFDYVRGGGALVVQYNTYAFDRGDHSPFPFTMNRPHDRVTDEDAPVRLLDPDHRILSWPNRITPADFDGWVQDKGLYYAHTWDERYTPLLEMNDPGEDPLRGGLLVASMGEGTYVYTGLAFFRQLPHGVPGAYRLFANLIALGAER